jgi:CheY-like chemotaxis protein/GAF domain-containing protein
MAKQTIVVVDDEAPARSAVARLLRERGFTVHALSSGQEAIDLAMKIPYDVLLTDFRMPDGLDGLTTVRAIRRILPQIVAIVMTGHNSVDLAIQSLNLGVHGFVVKPFTAYELTRTIEQAITKEQLVRENIKMRALVDVFNTTQALISADVPPEKLPNLTVELAVKEVEADYSFLFLAPRELSDDTGLQLLAVARREMGDAPGSSPLIYTLEVASYERDIPGAVEGLCEKAQTAIAQSTTLFYIDGEQIKVSDVQNNSLVPSQEKTCEIAVPLMVQGRQIGALVVVREGVDRSFSEVNLQTAGILGVQAAIAIDNTRLFRRLAKVEGEREADKLRSQFLANISHELRTPLTYIKGYATTLLRPDVQWDSQTGIEYLNIINDECDKLLQLIVNTLEISKMESGALRITPEPTNILEVVERIYSSGVAQQQRDSVRSGRLATNNSGFA